LLEDLTLHHSTVNAALLPCEQKSPMF